MRNIDSLRKWSRERWLEIFLTLGLVGVLIWLGSLSAPMVRELLPTPAPRAGEFSGEAALQHVLAQVALGPRPTGSTANQQTADYISTQLGQQGWQVEIQGFTYRDVAARNIIGKAGKGPVVIIGAHYDTRRLADQDPDPARRTQPVLGANDGASGVAVLLELARALDKSRLTNEVWLTFFDAEDNGGLEDWEFIAGSTYMARTLRTEPEWVVIVDMVGDSDQQLYREKNSTPELVDRIWDLAAKLGYQDFFIPTEKWDMTDDHTPFLQRDIPAADIIDFDYPYWHTTQDTVDKVSAGSLARVGHVLQVLLGDEGKQ